MYIIQGSKLKSSQKALIFLEKYLFKKREGYTKYCGGNCINLESVTLEKGALQLGRPKTGRNGKKLFRRKKLWYNK